MKNMHYLCNQKKRTVNDVLQSKDIEINFLWVLQWVKMHSEKTGMYGVLMGWNGGESQIRPGKAEHWQKRRKEKSKKNLLKKKWSFQELKTAFLCLGIELSSQALKGGVVTVDCIIRINKCIEERVNISRYEWLHMIGGFSKCVCLFSSWLWLRSC